MYLANTSVEIQLLKYQKLDPKAMNLTIYIQIISIRLADYWDSFILKLSVKICSCGTNILRNRQLHKNYTNNLKIFL